MTVAAGQKLQGAIRAADWNDMQSILAQWRAGGRRIYFPDSLGKSTPLPSGWIWIQNTTGSNIAAFGNLALSQPIIQNVQEKYYGVRFKGIAPSITAPHYGKWCVLQEPAKANGGIARAIVSGVTYARVQVTHAADFAAELLNNDTSSLISGAAGTAKIIWKEGVGSNMAALIDISCPILCGVGKASGAIALDATNGTVAVWDPAMTGATGQTLSPCINRTIAIADLAEVSWTVILPSGKIMVAPLKCP